MANYFGLDCKTVKEPDLASLQRALGPNEIDGLQVTGMDDLAIQKGHRVAATVVEPSHARVPYVGRERGCCVVWSIFELLGPQRCKQLSAASTGMSDGYEIEVEHHCPEAGIVFDLFHVVAR